MVKDQTCLHTFYYCLLPVGRYMIHGLPLANISLLYLNCGGVRGWVSTIKAEYGTLQACSYADIRHLYSPNAIPKDFTKDLSLGLFSRQLTWQFLAMLFLILPFKEASWTMRQLVSFKWWASLVTSSWKKGAFRSISHALSSQINIPCLWGFMKSVSSFSVGRVSLNVILFPKWVLSSL